MLVIPIGEGLLFVEPLYIQAATGKIPELKRVILATSERVIMAENLGLALAELFGQDILAEAKLAELALTGKGSLPTVVSTETEDTSAVDLAGSTLEELILEANSSYSRAQDALLSGNWAAYGAELDALQELLQRMLEESGISPDPTPTPMPTHHASVPAHADAGSRGEFGIARSRRISREQHFPTSGRWDGRLRFA